MPEPSFARYLAAKQTVDDRSLNAGVWQAWGRALAAAPPARPLHLLELGAGIGTMIERLLAADFLDRAPTALALTALDVAPELLAEAAARLPPWATAHGWQSAAPAADCLNLTRRRPDGLTQTVSLHFLAATLNDYLASTPAAPAWDALSAHAFLDLIDLARVLPPLLARLRPGGWGYFSLNFDGLTLFEPPLDPPLDAAIVRRYHAAMDAPRLPEGRAAAGSHSGRRLLTLLPQAGADIAAAGASDWVVFPQAGSYPADEAYFLHHIQHFVAETLAADPEIDPTELARWLTARRAQIEAGELIFIAHQLDVLTQRRP
jgi:hypothetical protein